MRSFVVILFIVLLSGCGSVISKGALKDVDRTVTIPMVQSEPSIYEGRTVAWGGLIVSIKNTPGDTVIEVLERPLDYLDLPESEKETRGRFLIKKPGYLDALVYKPDLLITVVGIIRTVESRAIGEMNYLYPVVVPIEMKLSEPYSPLDPMDRYVPGYYDPWWDFPYYPSSYYPYYDPWLYRRGHRHYP